MSENTHGGKRPGAGRPTQFGARKEPVPARLTPTVQAFLNSIGGPKVLEAYLRSTPGFQEWAATSAR